MRRPRNFACRCKWVSGGAASFDGVGSPPRRHVLRSLVAGANILSALLVGVVESGAKEPLARLPLYAALPSSAVTSVALSEKPIEVSDRAAHFKDVIAGIDQADSKVVQKTQPHGRAKALLLSDKCLAGAGKFRKGDVLTEPFVQRIRPREGGHANIEGGRILEVLHIDRDFGIRRRNLGWLYRAGKEPRPFARFEGSPADVVAFPRELVALSRDLEGVFHRSPLQRRNQNLNKRKEDDCCCKCCVETTMAFFVLLVAYGVSAYGLCEYAECAKRGTAIAL